MKCGKPANVSLILVGLHQVGIVGLRDALRAADRSGLQDPEEILDFLSESLAADNYLPDSQKEDYRRALWREFLRHRGEDFREFYSSVAAEVQGVDGRERDRFVEMLTSVFADFELQPTVTYLSPVDEDTEPVLRIGGETIVRGYVPRAQFKAAVRRRISEW